MYEQILEMLLDRYGHLSYPELTAALKKDGLGEFVDAIEDNPDIMKLISELSRKFPTDLLGDIGTGTMPSTSQQIRGIPVDYHETISFDHKACLERCAGNCCKEKNYIMINFTDIFSILLSPAAEFLEIRSTRDLFEKKPPVLELFFLEEYKFYQVYIRFLPVDADLNTRPEDAKSSICPFLYPINEVYSYRKKELPKCTGRDAMGCVLMGDKPAICRLSPLGKNRGMITGKVTYEYLPPALECPACETDVEVRVSDYVSSVESSSEERQQERFHQMLIHYDAKASEERDQRRFNEILKQIYNIDSLLSQYGLGLEHRPDVDQLVEIVIAAAKGDFSLYEQFIEGLNL